MATTERLSGGRESAASWGGAERGLLGRGLLTAALLLLLLRAPLLPAQDGPEDENDFTATAVLAPPAPAAQTQTLTPGQKLFAAVSRIQAKARQTVYSHQTRVDEKAGIYELDCSGLVRLVLRQVAPRALAAIPLEGRKVPLAAQFQAALAAAAPLGSADGGNLPQWRRIPNAAEGEPGDLLAWRYAQPRPNGNTGHVMILARRPARDPDGQLRVVIVDSTAAPHAEDTRKPGQSGVGQGTIWLTVNASGEPTGYRRNSARGKLYSDPISVGRLVDDR